MIRDLTALALLAAVVVLLTFLLWQQARAARAAATARMDRESAMGRLENAVDDLLTACKDLAATADRIADRIEEEADRS